MVTLDLLAQGRSFADQLYRQAFTRANSFLPDLEEDPATELMKRGCEVNYASLSVPGALVRGKIDLQAKTIWLDPAGIDDLLDRTAKLGEKSLTYDQAANLILAHELYHLLDPDCPSEIRELAAIIFSTQYMQLDYLLDA